MNNKNKGFYIVLSLCIVAIGFAGYVNFTPEPEVINTNADVKLPVVTVEKPETLVPQQTLEETSVTYTPEPEPEPAPVPTVSVTPVITKEEKVLYVRATKSGEVLLENSNDQLLKDQTMNDWRTYNATAYTVEENEPIFAISNGTVKSIETNDQYATIITIEHDDGIITKTFGLNSDTTAKIDKKVVAGDVIGTAIGTFSAEKKMGNHVRIEATRDGENINIEKLFE